jgi:hypothetical protein
MRIKERHVAPDQPTLLQFSDPLKRGRWSQFSGSGKLYIGHPTIFLKGIKYAGIFFVNHSAVSLIFQTIYRMNAPFVKLYFLISRSAEHYDSGGQSKKPTGRLDKDTLNLYYSPVLSSREHHRFMSFRRPMHLS